VNTITPGFFPAEQNRKLLFNDDGSPTARTKSIWGHTPMNRFGESHELIGAAVFLASHRASSFVTGTDIRVDGGPMFKRIRPRARGMAFMIKRRMSHVSVKLEDINEL